MGTGDVCENLAGGLGQPDGSRSGLAVAKEQMTVAVIGPAQGQDLAFPASRQQQEAHGRDLQWSLFFPRCENCCNPANFLIREVPFAPLAPVAPDAPAGIGAFWAQPHEFGFPENDGQDRHGAVGGHGRGPKGAEPSLYIAPGDLGDVPSGELGQDLAAQVGTVHPECSGLPDPRMAPEHGFGDSLEAGVFGLATDCVQNGSGALPCLIQGHGVGVSDGFPNAFPPVLDVDEEAPRAPKAGCGRRSQGVSCRGCRRWTFGAREP